MTAPVVSPRIIAYCNAIVKKPWTFGLGVAAFGIFCVVFGICFDGVILANNWSSDGVKASLKNFFGGEDRQIDWLAPTDFYVTYYDTKNEAVARADLLTTPEKNTRMYPSPGQQYVAFLFENHKGDPSTVFSPLKLQAMCHIERIVTHHPRYKDFCWRYEPENVKDETQCIASPRSVVNFFYGPGLDPIMKAYMAGGEGEVDPFAFFAHNYSCPLLSDKAISERMELITNPPDISKLNLDSNTKQQLDIMQKEASPDFFLGHDFKEPQWSSRTRSMVLLGGPLPTYRHEFDRYWYQTDVYKLTFWREVQVALKEHFNIPTIIDRSPFGQPEKVNEGGMSVKWWSPMLFTVERDALYGSDATWAALAVFLVFIVGWIYTGSAFYMACGVAQVLLSFAYGYFLLRVIFQVRYFASPQKAVIFIMLGIGADNLFVLYDAWRDYKTTQDIGRRLAYTWQRATFATLNTSVTTMAAFVATATTDVMPGRVFGLFAALAVGTNWLLTLTLSPAVLIVTHVHMMQIPTFSLIIPKKWKAKISSSADSREEPSFSPSATSTVPSSAQNQDGLRSRDCTPRTLEAGSAPSEISLQGVESADHPSRDSVQEVEPEKDLTQRFIEKYYLKPFLLSGSKDITRFPLVPLVLCVIFLGYLAYNIYFASQLRPSDDTEAEQTFKPTHMQYDTVKRYIDNYYYTRDGYLQISGVFGIKAIDRSEYDYWRPARVRGTPIWDESFDLYDVDTREHIKDLCYEFERRICDAICLHPGLEHLWAIPDSTSCFVKDYENWYHQQSALNDTTFPPNPSREVFFDKLNEFRHRRPELKDKIGFVDGKLRFALVSFRSTHSVFSKYSVTKAMTAGLVKWQTDVQERTGFPSFFFEAGLGPVMMELSEKVVMTLFNGLAISVPICVIVLLAATQNYVITFYAIFTVAAIVITLLGYIRSVLNGQLGFYESIAGIAAVGFSVDYVVHLGHMYQESLHHGLTDRRDRTLFAAKKMGSTVIAGAVTTIAAGAAMQACQTASFSKLGLLIMLTIFFGFMYSLFFFIPLCYLVGPEGSCGDVAHIVAFFRNKSGGSKKELQQPNTS